MTALVASTPLSFEIPTASQAGEPPEVRGAGRDDVRLLVAAGERLSHHRFSELIDLLAPGDLMVVNTSATRPAAVPDDQGLVVHFSTDLPAGLLAVEVRVDEGVTSRPLEVDPPLALRLPGGGKLVLLSPLADGGARRRLWTARAHLPINLDRYLVAHGRPIRYSHIKRPWPLSDYQTVFAREPGSAEMPSAARPFTTLFVTALVSAGVTFAPIVLHTGVSSLEAGEPPYSEWYSVPASTARLVNSARAAGGRVVAVGTTVVRALESAADELGAVHPASGWTDLAVTPDRGVRVVDGLLTGWHEPESTHLSMLEAVGGPEAVAASYREALASGYRWHEFGDSHLILADLPSRFPDRAS